MTADLAREAREAADRQMAEARECIGVGFKTEHDRHEAIADLLTRLAAALDDAPAAPDGGEEPKPIVAGSEDEPDWMPAQSAMGLPEGYKANGSTGQEWVVRAGRWERIRKPKLQIVAAPAAPDGLDRDALRYRYLREKRSYYYGESYVEPSPREFGIEWHWQDSSPERPSFEEALDREVDAWLAETAEDSEILPQNRQSSTLPAPTDGLVERAENVLPKEVRDTAEYILAERRTNEGHGHVHPRPDGVKARCGGPSICGECARDVVMMVHGMAVKGLAEWAIKLDAMRLRERKDNDGLIKLLAQAREERDALRPPAHVLLVAELALDADCRHTPAMNQMQLKTLAEFIVRLAALSAPTPAPEPGVTRLTDTQIKHMADRFLGWRLPENFSPDGGISFKATFNEHTAHPMKHEPVGTNLFDAGQAEAMVRYMVEGMPSAPSEPAQDAGLIERGKSLAARMWDVASQRTNSPHLALDAQIVDDLLAALKAAPILAEGEIIERCAQVAENVKGGFTANIRTSPDEQELIRDPDGPWVLNSYVAKAIRALTAAEKGAADEA